MGWRTKPNLRKMVLVLMSLKLIQRLWPNAPGFTLLTVLGFPYGRPRRPPGWNVDKHSAPLSCPEVRNSCFPVKHPSSDEATDPQFTEINALLQECWGFHTGPTWLPLGLLSFRDTGSTGRGHGYGLGAPRPGGHVRFHKLW